jgi:hypothetical protein
MRRGVLAYPKGVVVFCTTRTVREHCRDKRMKRSKSVLVKGNRGSISSGLEHQLNRFSHAASSQQRTAAVL